MDKILWIFLSVLGGNRIMEEMNERKALTSEEKNPKSWKNLLWGSLVKYFTL